MITAPYNFVPLNEKIFYPPWASEDILKNIHDVPFKDGESGVIEVEITAKSPIFIKDSKNRTEFCHFVKENGGKEYYIPATSVKGMIRNVLEIMSFSAMSFIDDKKYSMRDLNNPDYKNNVIKDIKCGWLYREGNEFKIRECDGIYRIKYQEIGSKFGIENYRDRFLSGKFDDKNDPLKNACAKYDLVKFENVDKIYNFSRSGNKNGRIIVCFDDNGPMQGKVVLTGHPSARVDNKDKPSGKNYDFVFMQKKDAKIFNVSKNTFEVFKFAYFDGRNKQPIESADWAFWKEKLKNGKEVPVFFHAISNEVSNFGLSYLYKFPFSKTVKEVLEHTQVRENRPDLAELIFGFSRKTNGIQESLKGRVFISHAKTADNIKVGKETKLVLGSPKASYYPIYLRQNGDKYITYDNKNAELSGYKRYAVHKNIAKSNADDKAKNVETSITPLEAGAKFKFKIVLHNMLPIEIGALLSAITFHQNNSCYHSIGMAKPLGYGKIKLSILNFEGFKNDIKGYLQDFESAINSSVFNGEVKWHESEQIKNLFSMSSEQNNKDGSELIYMKLEDFAKSKNSDRRYYLDRYIKLSNINTVQAVPLSNQQSISSYQKFLIDLELREKILREKREIEKREKELKTKDAERQKATSGMSELDKRIYDVKNDPAYKNMPELTVLFKAINETVVFDDIKFEALCKLREMFIKAGKWKEETKQKKPEKDRDYQDTLKIISMLKEFQK